MVARVLRLPRTHVDLLSYGLVALLLYTEPSEISHIVVSKHLIGF